MLCLHLRGFSLCGCVLKLFLFPAEDFDQRIMEYFINLIKKKHGEDISKDNGAVGKLRREAEHAKRALSSQHQVRVEIESLFDDIDLSEPLTQARFEELFYINVGYDSLWVLIFFNNN